MSPSLAVSLVGFIVSTIGTFMPWYAYDLLGSQVTFKAITSSTGKILIVTLLLSLGMSYLGKMKSRRLPFVGALFFAFVALVVVSVNSPSQAPIAGIEAQTGFYLSALGTLLLGLGALIGLVRKG